MEPSRWGQPLERYDWVKCYEPPQTAVLLDRISGRSSWTAPPPSELGSHDGSPKKPPRVGEVYTGSSSSLSPPPSHMAQQTPPVALHPYSYYSQRKHDDATGGSSTMSESSSSDGEFYESKPLAAVSPPARANISPPHPPPPSAQANLGASTPAFPPDRWLCHRRHKASKRAKQRKRLPRQWQSIRRFKPTNVNTVTLDRTAA